MHVVPWRQAGRPVKSGSTDRAGEQKTMYPRRGCCLSSTVVKKERLGAKDQVCCEVQQQCLLETKRASGGKEANRRECEWKREEESWSGGGKIVGTGRKEGSGRDLSSIYWAVDVILGGARNG